MNILSPISLKFNGKHSFLETTFLEYYYEQKIFQQRVAMIIWLITFSVFSFLDKLMIPEMQKVFIALRLFFVLPVGTVVLLLSFTSFYKRHSQIILFINNLIVSNVIVIMILLADSPVSYLYYAGLILVMIYSFTFSGLRFIYSLILGVSIIGIYEIVAQFLTDIPFILIANNNFFLISAGILALYAGYYIEYFMRVDYHKSILLENEKEKTAEVNNQLEEKVQKRTYQLNELNKKLKNELNKSKKILKDQESLQKQLIQTQKIEGICQLTTGITHDFNNILTIINGYSSKLLSKFDESSTEYDEIKSINEAGTSAEDLIKQLTTFSRKQMVELQIIDVNNIIKITEKMLARLIEKNIDMQFAYCEDTITIEMDPSQLEQTVLNLAINARDAMPDGGKIRIQTSKLEIDDSNESKYYGIKNGTYVSIVVLDNGMGMDVKTVEHIFEPFFTTKEIGKGTGLGLSTVHGIVIQNGGNIYVSSKPGKGSRFQILLPFKGGVVKKEKPSVKPTKNTNESKCILVIEDNHDILKFIRRILQENNYSVFTAYNSDEAESAFNIYKDQIDLVVSDVILPGKSGKKIVEGFKEFNPALKCLYISGYTNDILGEDGIISDDINFLPKPFREEKLLSKIQEILYK